jgi:hypothetical protein
MKQIPLYRRPGKSRGKLSASVVVAYTFVDDIDHDYLNQWQWNLQEDKRYLGLRYAVRKERHDGKIEAIYMHRVVLERILGRRGGAEIVLGCLRYEIQDMGSRARREASCRY